MHKAVYISWLFFMFSVITAGKNGFNAKNTDLIDASSYVPYPTDWSNFDAIFERFQKSQKKFNHVEKEKTLKLFDHPMLPPSIDNPDDDTPIITHRNTSKYYQIAQHLAYYTPCLNKARNCSLEDITAFICEIFSKFEEDCLWNSLGNGLQLRQRFILWAVNGYWNILLTQYTLQKRSTELENEAFLLLQKVYAQAKKYRDKHQKL